MFGKLKAKVVAFTQNEKVRKVTEVVVTVAVICLVMGAIQTGTREVDNLLTSIIHHEDETQEIEE